MYAYFEGKIVAKNEEQLILDNGGIGYAIMMAPRSLASLPAVGEECHVPVSFQVREDMMTLYGFSSEDEKKLYELIITVNGIGPRMGMQIIDDMAPEDFAMAVINEDVDRLTTIKGVGKKTAQRIILDLRDKLKERADLTGDLKDVTGGAAVDPQTSKEMQDVAEALSVLGYQSSEIKELMTAYDPELTVEENVKALLRHRVTLL